MFVREHVQKGSMVESVYPRGFQETVCGLLPNKAVLWYEKRTSKRDWLAKAAASLESIVEFPRKTENNLPRMISTAVKTTDRSAESCDGGAPAKPISLHKQHV
jgi:hypothetical protein